MSALRDDPRAAARHAWSTGRYPSLAPNLLPAIARLVSAAGVDPGDRVLDVGCGTGNVALTARRAGARVVGVDLARRMLELARASAAVAGEGGTSSNDDGVSSGTDGASTSDDGLSWLEGDAEALPFADGTFDAVLSSFGHVFAPNPETAGRELVRVADSGGRVAFTAWSPDGVVGELTEVLTDHVADPPDDPWSHLEWGDPAAVRDRLRGVEDLSFQRRIVRFRYVSPEHFWQEFAEESGPLAPAVSRLPEGESRAALRRDAVATLEEWFGDNAVRVEYLQVRAVVA